MWANNCTQAMDNCFCLFLSLIQNCICTELEIRHYKYNILGGIVRLDTEKSVNLKITTFITLGSFTFVWFFLRRIRINSLIRSLAKTKFVSCFFDVCFLYGCFLFLGCFLVVCNGFLFLECLFLLRYFSCLDLCLFLGCLFGSLFLGSLLYGCQMFLGRICSSSQISRQNWICQMLEICQVGFFTIWIIFNLLSIGSVLKQVSSFPTCFLTNLIQIIFKWLFRICFKLTNKSFIIFTILSW